MLIDSPRLTDYDRSAWGDLERYDRALAGSARLERLVTQGVDAIHAWRDAGDGVASVSWGKDSVVMAHLVAVADPTIPFVWVRSGKWESPECDDVRDAFLARHPDIRYEERIAKIRNPKRGEPGFEAHHLDPLSRSQDTLTEEIPERYISGVRAEESRTREKSARVHGMVTARTCRPLLWWRGVDVFAYLYQEGLPVHPAYAMSFGGRWDRRWLRVHALCSFHDSRRTVDVPMWEDHYYGDHIAQLLRKDSPE